LRVELPSKRPGGTENNWVELRDRIRPLDRPAIQEAGFRVTIESRDDGTEVRHVTGGGQSMMQFALLARVITAWSFDGVPVPSQNIAKGEDVLDSVFTDEDDWDVICEAVQPMLDRILSGRPKTETKTEESPA
jgi:hypothetical protein